MKGIDISHWQGNINWSVVKTDFAILKASQGIVGLDQMFQTNKTKARANNILLGYYHYAIGADPVQEATHFVKTVGDIQQGEFLALDYEIHLPYPVDWCLTFLQEVEKQVGFKPMLYINSSTCKSFNWMPVVNNDNGLWIANYGLNLPYAIGSPSYKWWPFYAIWQYSSRGRIAGVNGNVDLDYTKMDLATLKLYGKQ